MKITNKKFIKYFYVLLVIIWALITVHLLYTYVEHISAKVPAKGGTLIEGSFEKISYLPYLSQNTSDKMYQSFLFRGCMNPYVSGTQIIFEEDLCSVQTKNHKTFEVQMKPNKQWSDGQSITLEDVFFTYHDIIKENMWEIPGLSNYSNIEVSLDMTNEVIKITFPHASLDNRIFFTNFILPKHILTNMTLEQYIDNFSLSPIKNNCAGIQDSKDSDSIVFDLSNCQDVYIDYYQVKQFDNMDEFQQYISQEKNQIIDIYHDNETLEGFKTNKIILNRFITLFFNTQSELMTTDIRKAFANTILDNIYTGDYEKDFIKDNFLFDANIEGGALKKLIESKNEQMTKTRQVPIDLPDLPLNLNLGNTGDNNTGYFMAQTDERINLKISIPKGYDKISVKHKHSQDEYFFREYVPDSTTFFYSLSKRYNNLYPGQNVYTFRGYKGDKAEIIDTLTLYYQDKPTKEVAPDTDQISFKILYYGDDTNRIIINKIKEILQSQGLEPFFEYERINSPEEFEGRTQSQDYEIIMRGIDMGLKKDISNIFATENSNINPSVYKNSELASLINQYFISDGDIQQKIKKEIDSIYAKEVPLIILGKSYGKVNVRQSLDLSFPFRLYDYWFTKDFIKEIILKHRAKLDMNKIMDKQNFIKFIQDGYQGKLNTK